MSKGLEKVSVLGDVAAETLDLEVAGGQAEREGMEESEDRFAAELDPEEAGEAGLVVDDGGGDGGLGRSYGH